MVPEGDIIVGVHIHSGWLVDRMTFITREGVHLGPLGRSDGGNVYEVDVKDFWPSNAPTSNGQGSYRRNLPFHVDSDYYDSDDNDDGEGGREDGGMFFAVALHGFSYTNINSKQQTFWNNIRLHFAALDKAVMFANGEVGVISSGETAGEAAADATMMIADVMRLRKFHV